jgi:hypothetical protein
MIARDGLEVFAARATPAMGPALLPSLIPHIPQSVLPFLTKKVQLAEVAEKDFPYLTAKQFHLLPQEKWSALHKEDLMKYGKEETLPKGAKELVGKINPEWVNDLDPRLAAYYSEEQIKKISGPSPVKHLQTAEQFTFLNPALADYLEPAQLAMLTAIGHASLIKALKDPNSLAYLSKEALEILETPQVKALPTREALLRSPVKHHPLFSRKQVEWLDPNIAEDREVIKNLVPKQIKNFGGEKLKGLIPHLNAKAVGSIPPIEIGKMGQLPPPVIKQLNVPQLQTYLQADKKELRNLAPVLKSVTSAQWEKMDEVFIHNFFEGEPKEVLACLPKKRASALSDKDLLRWHKQDTPQATLINIAMGFLATLFFPITILAALFTGLRHLGTKTGFKKAFKIVITSPMRLFKPAKYYRALH